MSCMEKISARAKRICPRIVFPEAGEVRILQVAQEARARGIARPILLGEPDDVSALAAQNGIRLDGVPIIPLADAERDSGYAQRFMAEHPETSEKMMLRKLRNPLYLAACMVHFCDAESFIAGFRYTTGEVILAASMIIGISDGVPNVSSFNLVTIPGFSGSEGESVIFTDVAVCVDPGPAELANAAALAAGAAKRLLGWEPRIAFLSYSTKGSGESAQTRRVLDALALLRELRPDVKADGEFQLEVALSPAAAAKKLETTGDVAGRANIIVFPDLNAGNTNIKAVKLFSHADSLGPILTGFQRPVSDLSRTGSIEHLMGTVAAISALCGENGGAQ